MNFIQSIIFIKVVLGLAVPKPTTVPSNAEGGKISFFGKYYHRLKNFRIPI